MQTESTKKKNDNIFRDNYDCFPNKIHGFSIKFPKYSSKFELFSLQENDCKFTMFFEPHTASPRCLIPQFIRLKDMTSNKTMLRDYILYENISAGIDIAFYAGEGKIDETIIIKEKLQQYKLSYLIHYSNMYWEYSTNVNKICFFDVHSQDEIMYIPFPCMSDISGAISIGMVFKFKQISDTCLQIDMEIDNKWIEDNHKVLPINIHQQFIIHT